MFEEEENKRAQFRYEEEKKIEEMRFQMKSLFSDVNGDSSHNNSSQADPFNQGESFRIKLPKLVMTKF